MHSEYYQGIIQLRNPNEQVSAFLEKALGTEISKVKKVKNGFDYYIKDNKNALKATIKARDRFGGEHKINRKLYSQDRQTSKNVYRMHILLRLPEFAKNDVIKFENNLIKIVGLGKKVTGLNIKTGKKKVFNYPEKFQLLEMHETQIIKIKPRIEILHPETYQSEPVMNKKNVKIGDKVKIVFEKGFYLV